VSRLTEPGIKTGANCIDHGTNGLALGPHEINVLGMPIRRLKKQLLKRRTATYRNLPIQLVVRKQLDSCSRKHQLLLHLGIVSAGRQQLSKTPPYTFTGPRTRGEHAKNNDDGDMEERRAPGKPRPRHCPICKEELDYVADTQPPWALVFTAG